jgi:hypothetical protein
MSGSKMQVWAAVGQSPSQVGAIDCSQATGSQMHPVAPAVPSATQFVPGGQSPSQVGKGDCSQGTFGGWHRHRSRLGMAVQIWVASGHGPSQTGNAVRSHGMRSHRQTPVTGSGTQTVPGGQSPSQFGNGDTSHLIGSHSQKPAALGTQVVSGGQTPSQFGKGDWSQGTSGGRHRHASRLFTKVQAWIGSGHGPSQIGASDRSHGIGSQRHWVTPEGSVTQTVPTGHAPSQVGNGDCSHGRSGGSQRHASFAAS